MQKNGISGSRDGLTTEAKQNLINYLEEKEIEEAHHGDCVGVDTIFHDIVLNKGIKIIIHPPNVNTMRSFCNGDEIREEINV